jgi:hypothetical protein
MKDMRGSRGAGHASPKLGVRLLPRSSRLEKELSSLFPLCVLFSSRLLISSPVSAKLGPSTPSLVYYMHKYLTYISMNEQYRYPLKFISIPVLPCVYCPWFALANFTCDLKGKKLHRFYYFEIFSISWHSCPLCLCTEVLPWLSLLA